jgi:hypothetical protein
VLFLYFVSFGKKTLKIYQVPSLEKSLQETKVGRLILGKIRIQFNFGIVCCKKRKKKEKREIDKIYYFLKDSRMSTSLYFNHKFLLKYWIGVKLEALES